MVVEEIKEERKTYNGVLLKIGDCDNPRYANNKKSGDQWIGSFSVFPEVGKSFFISIKGEKMCFFRSSLVHEIIDETESIIMFRTSNSIYRLRYEIHKVNGEKDKD